MTIRLPRRTTPVTSPVPTSPSLPTDQDWKPSPRCAVKKVDPPFDRSHGRYGWRANDYYVARGVLDSQADIAIDAHNFLAT